MKHFFKTTATALLLALLLSGGAGAARTEFLIPGGETIGLQLQFDGISVVEFAESNPCAKEAGLKKGDLIFFPGHVAIYLGDDKYIHSTGYTKTPCVTINSFRKEDPDFRADLVDKITECGSVFA